MHRVELRVFRASTSALALSIVLGLAAGLSLAALLVGTVGCSASTRIDPASNEARRIEQRRGAVRLNDVEETWRFKIPPKPKRPEVPAVPSGVHQQAVPAMEATPGVAFFHSSWSGGSPAVLRASRSRSAPGAESIQPKTEPPVDWSALPEGTEVTVTRRDQSQIYGEEASADGSAKARSQGVVTDAPEVAAKQKVTLPGLNTGPGLWGRGGGSGVNDGGESSIDFEFSGAAQSLVLYLAGIACMIAGAVAARYLFDKKWLLYGVGVGLLLIGCGVVVDTAPWIFEAAIGVLALLGVGGIVALAVIHGPKLLGLRTIVTAIESVTVKDDMSTLGEQVKDKIEKVAGKTGAASQIKKATNWAKKNPVGLGT